MGIRSAQTMNITIYFVCTLGEAAWCRGQLVIRMMKPVPYRHKCTPLVIVTCFPVGFNVCSIFIMLGQFNSRISTNLLWTLIVLSHETTVEPTNLTHTCTTTRVLMACLGLLHNFTIASSPDSLFGSLVCETKSKAGGYFQPSKHFLCVGLEPWISFTCEVYVKTS